MERTEAKQVLARILGRLGSAVLTPQPGQTRSDLEAFTEIVLGPEPEEEAAASEPAPAVTANEPPNTPPPQDPAPSPPPTRADDAPPSPFDPSSGAGIPGS